MEANYNVNNSPSAKTKLSVLPMFLLTLAAFICLVLITFSLPLVHSMYFLWSSQAGGVRFGIWGWCLDEGPVCTETLRMGYFWEPEVSIPITKALVFYPISVIVVLLALIAFILVLRNRSARTLRVFAVFAWVSLVSALVAFGFMIAMWSVIEERFKAAGWKVRWGPLPWISFVSVVLLMIVAVNTWKGRLSPSYHAVQDSSSKVEPRLQQDPEKAIISSNPSIPTSNPASPTTAIAAPPPCYSSISMKEVGDCYDSTTTPVGGIAANAKKGWRSAGMVYRVVGRRYRWGVGEGNLPGVECSCSPPEAAVVENVQKQYRIRMALPGGK